jgi:hypothetical protein
MKILRTLLVVLLCQLYSLVAFADDYTFYTKVGEIVSVSVPYSLQQTWDRHHAVIKSWLWQSLDNSAIERLSQQYWFQADFRAKKPGWTRVRCSISFTINGYYDSWEQIFSVYISGGEPTSVSLSGPSSPIMVGRTATLYPKLYPEGSETTFSWETSDRKIATVSGGVVTGVGEGQARITVRTANGKSDYCYVNVYNPQPTGIKINSTNFPDEDFRNWLLKQDYGSDGVLTDTEIANVKRLDFRELNVNNMSGIEYFTSLIELDCSYCGVTVLDVSKNTALERLDCKKNKLTSLDVSKNTALEILD